MADIFISYSRHDSEQALALAERLRASGASVWIDTAALTAAETWSAEIVNAINSCKTFIILLSPDSVASHNVTKELSLASEKRKTILPIVLNKCKLNEAMEYALAGLQQVLITDEPALERAFAKLGITGSGFSQVVEPPRTSRKRKRMLAPLTLVGILLAVGAYFLLFSNERSDVPSEVKTIAVLPFESLSADKENEYFTDGMTATLIDMLTSIPELQVIDRRTSMEYKASTLDVKSLGAALASRYIVSGRVQRQGDKVMINAEMTDAESGTVLFSRSFSGKTTDLLELQKQIAESIVVELQLAFNPDNSLTFTSATRSSNPRAHELCMKADYAEEHYQQDTAIAYYIQAATHDTAFSFPYLSVARIYGNMYMIDTPDARYLTRADSFLAIGKRLDTAQRYYHHVASWIATVHGDFDKAIAEATSYIKKEPRKSAGYNTLALAYVRTKQYELAAQNFTEELKRDPSSNNSRVLLMFSLWLAHDTLRLHQCATQAIPIFEASLMRRPDDKAVRNNSIPLALVWSGRGEEACKRMEQLIKTPNVDPQYFLNTAAINALSGKRERAMELMRSEVKRIGMQKVDFDRPFFDNIRSLPEFREWEKQKEALTKKNG